MVHPHYTRHLSADTEWHACYCQWVSITQDTTAGVQQLELIWDHPSERTNVKAEISPFQPLSVSGWFVLCMLPRAFPPTSSETYNIFTKNSSLVLASPCYINGEALSPLLLLWSRSFRKCPMRGLRFYSEMTLGSSNFRLDLQAAVAVQTLLEVTETQKAQFYHSMKAFKSRFHEGWCLEDTFNTYLAATLYRPYLKQWLFLKKK